jgi:hypothetical protein
MQQCRDGNQDGGQLPSITVGPLGPTVLTIQTTSVGLSGPTWQLTC